ncbi:MAG: hypothetical protein DMG38_00005 [Acidobacteria bacterium]|nr:MAG: hypothetical protein DMG38_00005 [Acidobacteriota bacterium]
MSPCSCPSSSALRFPLLLRLRFFVLFGLVLCVADSSQAQAKVELFGGYSYVRASIKEGQFGPLGPGTPCPPNCGNPPHIAENANLNGWEFSGQYKFLPFFGGVVDFHGTYGKLHGASTREHTYLVGPQVSLPFKYSPFVHALVGFARESQDTIAPSAFFSLGSDTSWASALGGGLDWHVAPFVAVRVLQIDNVHTQLHGTSQNQPRVSAGIVFHF